MGRTLDQVEKKAKDADELTKTYISVLKTGLGRIDRAIESMVNERNAALEWMSDEIKAAKEKAGLI